MFNPLHTLHMMGAAGQAWLIGHQAAAVHLHNQIGGHGGAAGDDVYNIVITLL
jgi:hypothetical protein